MKGDQIYLSLDSFLGDLFNTTVKPLPNRTSNFMRVLSNQSENPQFFMNAFIKAGFGEGKTTFGFMVGWRLIRYDKYVFKSEENGDEYPRTFCVFRPTAQLVENIREACKKYCIENGKRDLSGRYYGAEEISDIKPNSFVLCDEGISTFFKEDHGKDFIKNFVKSIQRNRHFRISWWINCSSNDLLTEYRKIANYIFYKCMPKVGLMFSSMIDEFERAYKEQIFSLNVRQAIFLSTSKELKNECCLLEIDLNDPNWGCPWYNDKISMNASLECYDVGMNDLNRRTELIDKMVQIVISSDKDGGLSSSKWRDYAMGYVSTYHQKEYLVIKRYKTEFLEKLAYAIKSGECLITRKMHSQITIDESYTFARYMKDNIVDSLEADIIYLWLQGMSYGEIEKVVSKSTATISAIVSEYKCNYIQFCLEDYVLSIFGYDPKNAPHNQGGIPDLIDTEGRILEKGAVYSIKFSYRQNKTISFNKGKDLSPEFRYAKENNQDHFYLITYCQSWRNGSIQISKVDSGLSDGVTVEKSSFKPDREKMDQDICQVLLDFEIDKNSISSNIIKDNAVGHHRKNNASKKKNLLYID